MAALVLELSGGEWNIAVPFLSHKGTRSESTQIFAARACRVEWWSLAGSNH